MKKLAFIFIGMMYYLMIQINISPIRQIGNQYMFDIDSKIPQNIKLHVFAKRNQLKEFKCGNVSLKFPLKKRLWFERKTEEVNVFLKHGKTKCKIVPQDHKSRYKPYVKRKFTYVDYIVLFVFLGLPLVSYLLRYFTYLMDSLKNFLAIKGEINYNDKSRAIPISLIIILIVGMVIRVMYFNKFGVMHFQHDWQGHVELIKYIAKYWSLPLGEKGLQFPQQPLYYILMAGFYTFFVKLGMADPDALHALGYLSLFFAFVFLYYGAKFFTLVSESKWVQIVAMSYIAFTPSFVYMSARINNDVLVMALSAVALYYIVKSYQVLFQKYFYAALISTSLLFMTKISAAPIELLFFGLMVATYIKQYHSSEMQHRLFVFTVVGTFVLGLTLLKTYLPIEGTFHFVNSSSNFPGQTIKSLDSAYFGTFHILSLLQTGYSYVFGEDTIRYSFATYQYGTMFFGEFNYENYLKNSIYMKILMQIILFSGMVYIIGLLSYIANMRRASVLQKLILLTVIVNFLLIVKFLSTYPAVCNADYRYFVASFLLIAYIFSKGLHWLSMKSPYVRYLFSVFVLLLIVSEIGVFVLMLC